MVPCRAGEEGPEVEEGEASAAALESTLSSVAAAAKVDALAAEARGRDRGIKDETPDNAEEDNFCAAALSGGGGGAAADVEVSEASAKAAKDAIEASLMAPPVAAEAMLLARVACRAASAEVEEGEEMAGGELARRLESSEALDRARSRVTPPPPAVLPLAMRDATNESLLSNEAPA
jgi:hypothetical protein